MQSSLTNDPGCLKHAPLACNASSPSRLSRPIRVQTTLQHKWVSRAVRRCRRLAWHDVQVFAAMRKYHPHVRPNTVHFSSLISACATAGRWEEAMQVGTPVCSFHFAACPFAVFLGLCHTLDFCYMCRLCKQRCRYCVKCLSCMLLEHPLWMLVNRHPHAARAGLRAHAGGSGGQPGVRAQRHHLLRAHDRLLRWGPS